MSSSKIKTKYNTDVSKLDKRHKNKNKFCKKCKLKKDCWKGKVAAIAYCDELLST